nr:hypothetical protein B0A51_01737 [Rachicladosporium sp. CCFEE 5018]
MGSIEDPIPSSILIIGSGVFGLSTAYALSQRAQYAHTKITVVDRSTFPAPDAASIDASRIVRADYSDYHYSALCIEAQKLWRQEWGAEGRYHENGLVIAVNSAEDAEAGGKREEMQREMMANLKRLGLSIGKRKDGADVSLLEDRNAMIDIADGFNGAAGDAGYCNWTSGWTDAEAAMKYLEAMTRATGQVEFKNAEVESLLFDHSSSAVRGAELTDGSKIDAELVILAAGAWTPKFIDLRGVASASGQVLAYMDITAEEQAQLEHNPTMLNGSNGMFIIPPREQVLKVARHGYGYANFKKIPHPEISDSGEEIEVSLPWTRMDDPHLNIPKEGSDACRDFLAQCIPHMAERPWSYTRICWYSDTPKGDWLVDYHPKWKNLVVATGGSGHAYKFLPVVGERIADVVIRETRDDLGRALQEKWRWPKERSSSDHIWTNDWRGGRKGMLLDEEMARK